MANGVSGDAMVRFRPVTSAGRVAGIMLAVALVAAITLAVLDFPIARVWIGLGLAVYAAVLVRWPWAWLVAVPALLPVLDLSIWSGRFFLTEFDFVILTTLAVLYATGAPARVLPGLITRPYRLAAVLALSYIISIAYVLIPVPAIGIDSFSSYLSPFNALRVAKGFFWAWLLMPALLSELERDPGAARARFVTGVLAGLVGTGLAVLWERGVFVDLAGARSIYGLLNNLLDFSGSYRATGLFSDMHTGGEAIDGYLAVAAPFALYPVLFAKQPWIRALGLLVFGLATYTVMVTFSRGLYGGYALGLAGVAVTLAIANPGWIRDHKVRLAGGVALVFGYSALFVLLYSYGGFEPIAVGAFLIAVSTLAMLYAPARYRLVVPVLIAAVAALAAWRLYGTLMTSKWTENTTGEALIMSLLCVVATAAVPLFLARPLLGGARPFGVLTLLMLAGLAWAGTIPPMMSYQAQSRLDSATVERDLGTRDDHWRRSLAAADPSLRARLFGMGAGSFPDLFFSYMLGTGFPLANYHPVRDGEESYLRLGGGDFNIMQRVPIGPGETYRVEAKIRAEVSQPRLSMKFCHKHILYSSRYVPGCRTRGYRFGREDAGGEWKDFAGEIESRTLGEHGALYWPPTLMLHNSRGILHITDVRIVDAAGVNLIRNGDFSQGMDHWFLVSDFEHLAWHSKNLYLHLFIEQGAFGLLAFLALAMTAAFRLLRSVRDGDSFAIIVLPAVAGFLAVGIFGTLMDVPRVTTLFFLTLFMGHAIRPRPFVPPPGTGRV